MNPIRKLIVLSAMACLWIPATSQSQTDLPPVSHESSPLKHHRVIQVSFVPYFGTNGGKTDSIVNDISLNILAGSVYEVRSLELGSLLNFVRHDCNGFEAAGIGNFVGGSARGFQAAGIMNSAASLHGIQAAGLINYTREARGIQLAGLVNQSSTGSVNQVSGLVNHAADSSGFQIAGLVNGADSALFQVAGLVNNSHHARDFQIAGLVNQTSGRTGFQISGLVNHAKSVRGAQIGVVNLADSTGGIPIGVFNFIRNGYNQFEISTNELFYANIAYRSGIRQFHSLVTAGIDFTDLGLPLWTYGGGFGTTTALSRRADIDMDILFQHVLKGGNAKDNFLYKVDIGVDLKLFPNKSLYVGVSYNFLITDIRQYHYGDYYSDIAPYSLNNRTVLNHNLKQWIGCKAALRFR